MVFRLSTVGAARAFVQSVFDAGGFVPGRKPPSSWTDAYTVRLANAWQASARAGQPLTRQAARGHRATPEHPRQFVIRRSSGRTEVIPSHGIERPAEGQLQQREYRDPASLLRWIHRRIPGGAFVQVTARGELKPDYTDQATLDDGELDANGQPVKHWRAIYTGIPGGEPDENGQSMETLADLRAAERRVFVAGSVDLYVVRW